MPCGQPLQSAQLPFSLPCGQPLQSTQFFFSLWCGHGLQSAQKRRTFPWGHGSHSAQSTFRLPCRHRFFLLPMLRARRSPRASLCVVAFAKHKKLFSALPSISTWQASASRLAEDPKFGFLKQFV